MEIRPAHGSHRIAARAAISVAVPLLIVWSIGRLDWSIYACFGAFTSLYGRHHAGIPRFEMQAYLGLLMAGCVTAGVAVAVSPQATWISVALSGVIAAAATALSERYDWHPPGALFPIFAFAGCASIPAASADILPAAIVSTASAAFSVLVGIGGALLRHRTRLPGARVAPAEVLRPVMRHAVRAALAVAIAGSITTGVGIGHPYWAMVAAVVPLVSRDPKTQLVRGLHRLIGTALGLGLSALLLAAPLVPLGVIVVVVLLQAGAELLIGRNYAIALICITPLALLMGQLAAPRPMGDLLYDRAVETLIGVVIGLAVGYATARRDARTLTASAR